MFETVLSYWSGATIYFQLFRFALVLLAGAVLTRAVLIPAISRIYSKKDDKARHSIENLTGILGLFITFTVALQAGNFGGLVSVLAAIGAAATVAVGFGMRDQVANLTAGILIHLDNPFIKGDYIKVGDTEGVVKEIKMRSTQLNGAHDNKQMVPNSMLTTGVVKNYTRDRKTKVSIETSIDLKDAEKASELLLNAIIEAEKALEKPEPEIKYSRIEDGKLELEATYWVKKSSEVKKSRSEVLKAYTSAMEKAGLLEEKDEKKD
jgi:small conductance mechanosensitive channel